MSNYTYSADIGEGEASSDISVPDYIPDESSYGSDNQRDYSQEFSPYSVSSILTGIQNGEKSGLKAPGLDQVGPIGQYGKVDYLFVDEKKQRGEKGWGEKACYNTGMVYGGGLLAGGAWGVYEGLRTQVANKPNLRVNAILNGCTRRGPLIGNSGGVITLMYTSIDHILGQVRGTDDILNHAAAGGATGAIYKSSAGIKTASRTGLVFAGIATALSAAYNFYRGN